MIHYKPVPSCYSYALICILLTTEPTIKKAGRLGVHHKAGCIRTEKARVLILQQTSMFHISQLANSSSYPVTLHV